MIKKIATMSIATAAVAVLTAVAAGPVAAEVPYEQCGAAAKHTYVVVETGTVNCPAAVAAVKEYLDALATGRTQGTGANYISGTWHCSRHVGEPMPASGVRHSGCTTSTGTVAIAEEGRD